MQMDVCFWHKADIATALNDVRFWGQSGHQLAVAFVPVVALKTRVNRFEFAARDIAQRS